MTRALAAAPVDVTVLDRTNHHLFQPLLYEVATGLLSEGLIAPALRSVLKKQKNARALLVEVTAIDLQDRTVAAVAPDGQRLKPPYETLVVSAGATHAYFGHDEWADYAPGMKLSRMPDGKGRASRDVCEAVGGGTLRSRVRPRCSCAEIVGIMETKEPGATASGSRSCGRFNPWDQETLMSNVDRVKGKVKEAVGNLTGDKKLEREGKLDQAAGKVKKAVDKVKGAIKGNKR